MSNLLFENFVLIVDPLILIVLLPLVFDLPLIMDLRVLFGVSDKWQVTTLISR